MLCLAYCVGGSITEYGVEGEQAPADRQRKKGRRGPVTVVEGDRAKGQERTLIEWK